ncbi:MAG: hypothetical protein SGJ27_30440 [Candidatus Melainabacteria bacterium]|nr:hypothetical protein [Candidatus Melainabacteria bacterium]
MYDSYSSIPELHKSRLIQMQSSNDIPARWNGTPIASFIQAQNFGYPLHVNDQPQILISTCIEFRYALPIPAKYAYVIRTAGGRLIGQEFAVGYVLTKGVKNIILIAHDDCGMAKVSQAKEAIAKAFVQQGWDPAEALHYVNQQAEVLAIDDELDALEHEYYRLKQMFNDIHVAPLFLTLNDKRVHLPKWYHERISARDAQPH